MGIQSFTKVFKGEEVNLSTDLSGKTIIIDAMIELYRAVTGFRDIHTLTDPSGKPSGHYGTLLTLMMQLKRGKC